MFKIYDQADRYRIEISERFFGDVVSQVADCWEKALREPSRRAFIVDISEMTGYDVQGGRLLREMYLHGTQIAARNPTALGFLHELTADFGPGPNFVVRGGSDSRKGKEGKATGSVPVIRMRSAAAGK